MASEPKTENNSANTNPDRNSPYSTPIVCTVTSAKGNLKKKKKAQSTTAMIDYHKNKHIFCLQVKLF